MMLILISLIGAVVGGTSYAIYKKYSNSKLNTISETEFYRILEKTNLKSAYDEGKIKCSISGEPITFQNLGYVELRKNGEVIFISQENVSTAATVPNNELAQVIA